MFDVQGFEPVPEDTRNASTVLRETLRESVLDVRESVLEIRESAEDGEASGKSAVELAKQFKTSDRSIQNWYGIVASAYCWLPESDLKVGTGKNTRYTSLCIERMGELKAARDAGQTANDWIASVHDENADKLQQQKPGIQEVEATQSSQLSTLTVVEEEPTVSAIARIRQDRYHVPNTGSNRLAKAQQTHQTQRSNLQDTRERVRQAFMGLAIQTHENLQAEQLESEAGKEQTFEEAYADELERIQIENAAREAARADFAAFQEQVRMGNAHAPTAASASA